MADKRNRYDGKHSEEHGLPPGQVELDPRTHHADPAVATGELSQRDPGAPLNPRERNELSER